MDGKFLIHVEIADKSYGVWIKREDEELVREAAKQLRQKIYQYRQKYTQSDLEIKDLLAMVALQLAIKSEKLEDKNDTSPFEDKIKKLTNELEIYLNNK